MYKANTIIGNSAQAMAKKKKPFGPGLDKEAARRTSRIETWCSDAADAEIRLTVYVVFGTNGQVSDMAITHGH